MKRLVAASVFAAAFGAFATDYVWKGGSSTDWTLSGNYEPEAVPGSGDSVKVPDNTTLKLVSTDAASWAVANRLSYVKPQTATSYFEIEVPSGDVATLSCGVTNGAADACGGLLKTGSGRLRLASAGRGCCSVSVAAVDGSITVLRPKYEFYRLWLRGTVSGGEGVWAGEFGLFADEGIRQNGALSDAGVQTDALLLAPGEFSLGVDLYFYALSSGDISALFDDTTAAMHGYPRIGGQYGKVVVLDPDDDSTWLPVIMRLPADAEPVTSYDIVVGGTWESNPKARSVNNYLLQGSVDGISWNDLASTNSYAQSGANKWLFGGAQHSNGDGAVHTGGQNIAARPENLPTATLGGDGFVSVASGATIAAEGDDMYVSSVRVAASAASIGTLDNFRLSAAGMIDVTDLAGGCNTVTLPLVFGNATAKDIANLQNWSLTIDGTPAPSWRIAVSAEGRVRLSRSGLTLIVY